MADLPEEPGWLYHGTSSDQLSSIRRRGLEPQKTGDELDNRVWLTPDLGYANNRADRNASRVRAYSNRAADPVILRIPASHKEGELYDFPYSSHSIAPDQIQRLGDSGWEPLNPPEPESSPRSFESTGPDQTGQTSQGDRGDGSSLRQTSRSLANKAQRGKEAASVASGEAAEAAKFWRLLSFCSCGGIGVTGIVVLLIVVVVFAVAVSFMPGATDNAGATTYVPGQCSADHPLYTDTLSASQLQSLFGSPGSNQVSVSFMGSSTQVNKKVADCLEAVEAELKANNVTYQIRQFGCLRNPDAQIGDMSYHEYGAACDINWDTNPYVQGSPPASLPYDPNCHAGGHCYDIPPEVRSAFDHHGFFWGGNWGHTIYDYMHFEWHGENP